MIVLVDYDNVHMLIKQRGLTQLAQRIAEAIGPEELKELPRLQLRLYGGWLERDRATRRAQSLAAELVGFPVQAIIGTGAATTSIVVTAELAYGLIAEPRIAMPDTFRRRSGPGSVQGMAVPYADCCSSDACPLAALPRFFSQGQCPKAGCLITPDRILYRAEQKLVDSMIVADLLHLSHASVPAVGVVSTDDDMWPGIRLALLGGTRIHHIHPVPNRSTPAQYLVAVPQGYRQVTLN